MGRTDSPPALGDLGPPFTSDSDGVVLEARHVTLARNPMQSMLVTCYFVKQLNLLALKDLLALVKPLASLSWVCPWDRPARILSLS